VNPTNANKTHTSSSKGKGFVLVVACKACLDGCYLGASIAVNGTCLTATEFTDSQVSFGVAPETLRLTNLAHLKAGDRWVSQSIGRCV
jgi:riboflavin synthase